jgi:hypothetical protein
LSAWSHEQGELHPRNQAHIGVVLKRSRSEIGWWASSANHGVTDTKRKAQSNVKEEIEDEDLKSGTRDGVKGIHEEERKAGGTIDKEERKAEKKSE